MNIDAYHADFSRDSNTSLRLFEDSRERYAAIRVHRIMQPMEPTPAMLRGLIVDSLVLDGDTEFGRRFVIAPKCDRRTKDGKELWREFQQACNGRTLVDEDDVRLAHAMRDGIMRNAWARQWLESDGDCQRTFTWDHPGTSLPLKCRPDKILRNGLIGDLKMTGRSLKPDAWARTVQNFCYHGQAALYLEGTGADTWVWVVVSDEPPHECAVYTMGKRTRAVGEYVNDETLQQLAECKSSGDWSGEFSRDLHEIDLPYWELKRFNGLASL